MFMRHKNMIDYRLDHGSQIMGYRSFNHGSWIIDHGLWIIQLWIMNYRLFNHGSFQFNDHGLQIMGYQIGSYIDHTGSYIDYIMYYLIIQIAIDDMDQRSCKLFDY